MLLQQIFELVKSENARSKVKHVASFDEDVEGEHGEIAEAVDTINVLCRRIQFLTGEPDA